MVPELRAMQATTRALQSLAEVRNGYYDGWGAVGVKMAEIAGQMALLRPPAATGLLC